MKYLMLCFAMLIGLSSCKKEELESKLPPETTTGKNTAGFIVDGKTVILPSNSVSSVPGSGKSYGIRVQTGPNFNSPNDGQYFTIRITNSGASDVYSVRIRLHEYPTEPRAYIIGQSNGEYRADGPNNPQMIMIHSTKEEDTEWYYSSANSGKIIFTRVDNTLNIFSGTFEGTLYNKFDENKTIEISKGRFDINTLTLNK